MVQNNGGASQWLIYAKAVNFLIEDMTQISKINSLVLTVYATGANMYINVKGNVPGGITMANEKRLIDANALIAEYDRLHIGEPGKARKLIEDAPTVEAVEIVRCRECKHLNVLNSKLLYAHCPKTNTVFMPFELDAREHFCSLGERKDGDGNG